MEDRKDQKNAPWLSVPQFGDWDQKGELPDYSVDFSKIREMRKQNKRDASRASLGKEEELINPTARTAKPAQTQTQTQTHDHHHHYHQDHHDSPAKLEYDLDDSGQLVGDDGGIVGCAIKLGGSM
ncbi:PATHOGENIC TYPE III EFFECTOR AVIRULENCE FACTOR AVR AVRRPT-CLEAVAGE: CLEAVAGE SITE PROTEIN [Salix viminalis]|uniref:PATHOGENIC TYPE III EFFECTOR AVIRULENCE FACTOR AVR AVRRPT-CLEAVAGE: CLEAVAGE SITE PROTEIN n=1 Tax=Salix viminalis TaxID=40686 RepID=A0A9Q0UW13_SALVM|nr:PATHOGENIC TYPE III EFFECTOR AVIRULENCE FACTOR AVR AVRRPT-CLEAVAGE: CLEAVAGE SITE PROTEIN [Salix viminalis]